MVTKKELKKKRAELEDSLDKETKPAEVLKLSAKIELIDWILEQTKVIDARIKVLAVYNNLEYAFKQEIGREYPDPEVAARIVRNKNQVKSELSVFNFILSIEKP